MPPGAASIASAITQAIPSVIGLIRSGRMHKRGMRMFENTQLPEYTTPEEIYQNKALAARLAMSGMPAEQYQQALNSIGRNQTFGVNALQTRGGSVGNINALVGESNDAALNLAAADADARTRNTGVLMNANQALAGYEDKEYNINKLQKYLMRMAMASQLIGGGNAGINSNLNNLGISLANSAQDINFNKLFSGKENV